MKYKIRIKKLGLTLALGLTLLSCNNTSDDGGIVSEGLLTVPNVPGQWTYISLTTGRVVGTCALSDTASQRQWAQRTDWDLATCDGMLRTNGGDSGCGQGAAAVTDMPYDEADPDLPAPFTTDRDTIEIW